MSANVEITDTFDQWRTKSNKFIVMTQSAGSDDFIKLNNTTNSTSNTTGSITTAGGLGTGSSVTIAENLTLHGRGDLKSTVNFKDLIKRAKKGDIFVATDVFPEEPVPKNDPIRKVKNILYSAHRAGALESAFFNMGNIVLKDMNLISKNLKPKFCKIAQPKTVSLLASKPVAIN